MKGTWAKVTMSPTLPCPQPTLQTSPLPLPQASPLTWTLPSCSLLNLRLEHQWSTSRIASQFPQRLWQPPKHSVSYSSPPGLYALLLKDTVPQAKKNSSTSLRDWQELCKKWRGRLQQPQTAGSTPTVRRGSGKVWGKCGLPWRDLHCDGLQIEYKFNTHWSSS